MARTLGRTGIAVSPLGLAGGYGLTSAELVRAFHELSINYVHVSDSLTEGIRQLVRDGHRDQLVIGAGTTTPTAGAVQRAWAEYAQALRVEMIDVWHLYFVQARLSLRPSVWSAMRRLKEEGKVRALAISCHNRRLARQLAGELELDVLMIRYNAAHRGAEEELFDTLAPAPTRPGIVAYTATRWGQLLRGAAGIPPLTAPECYRFVLGHSQVDTVLCGASNYAQLRENALAVAAGPLDPARADQARRLGDSLRGRWRERFGSWGGR